ncbi:MobA-like NTP transferase domain protein [Rhodobacteraceae bacterium THAF1]|uniref:nucleotidyltransferase family protein n=1 Tax=Palleronia sp. THAF1 TaxID=2587842 RepID=UPI000F3D1F9B|nr:nucleotidyltransferase family protein [Palleronia sp. THAF1]QFU10137.1 MobA-like NTP transferase domain protein [Palleronia sp. THAF1]VDC16958.1 MobA-like NTP transferase domain protein [Rhodobacteraceae bacterium THAF1]
MSRPCMIFAAGFGTRMGALTKDRPKPMINVAGQPLIDRAAALARAAGAAPLVANTHYLADRIEPHLRDLDIAVSPEPDLILDTGGGLRKASPLLGAAEVFTLNPDALFTGPNPLTTLADAWLPDMGALLLCVPLDRAHGRKGVGDFALKDGALTRGGDLVYTGAQIIDTRLLDTIPEPVFSLNRIWFDLAERGALHGVVHPGHWADIGHSEGIAIAEDMLRV